MQSASPKLPSSRLVLPVLGVVLLLAAIVPELPALRGEFQWDDEPHISQNVNLRDSAGLVRTWTTPTSNIQYYPLSITSFWVEYKFFGLEDLAGYHLVNFLLHGVNAVLVWLVLRRLRVPWAWGAALLFAVHPLMVESVAYVSELKNLLSGFWGLLAALAWIGWGDGFSQRTQRAQRWGRVLSYVCMLVCFVLGMLAKSTVCVFPAVMLLMEYWQWGRVRRRVAVGAVPLFVIGLGMAGLFAYLEHVHVGAAGEAFDLSTVQRVLIAGRAVWFYVGKFIWPAHLLVVYPRWGVGAGDVVGWVAVAGVVAVLAGLFALRRRLGDGAWVAAAIFVVVVSPALGFVNFYPMLFTFVADHYVYLGAVPLAVLAMGTLRLGMARVAYGEFVAAGVLLVVLAPLTAMQAGAWRTRTSLWLPAAEANPGSWYVTANAANALVEDGRPEEAKAWAMRSLRLKEDNARTHFTLGRALLALQDPQGAAATLRRGLELEPSNLVSRYNYALALQESNDLPAAEAQWEQVVQQDPGNAKVWNNLAMLRLHRGAYELAAEAARKAVGIDGNYGLAHANLGMALEREGRFGEAAKEIGAALSLLSENPQARLELARCLAAAGDVAEAVRNYEQVAREMPGDLRVAEELRALERGATTAPTSGTRP